MASKLQEMAAAGDPWAVARLAKLQTEGRAASLRGWAIKRAAAERNPGGMFDTAEQDARDIREWTDGPRPAPWRIYRLAEALRRGR